MKYVLAAVQVPDQRRHYYAGDLRNIPGRKADKVTWLKEEATRFSAEEAEAMLKELAGQGGAGYEVLPEDDPSLK